MSPTPTDPPARPEDRPSGASQPAWAPAPTGSTPWAGRPDASMTLINEMLHRPLDPSYAAEAERRRAQGLGPARVVPWRLALAAFLIGLLLVTAARTLRQPKDAVAGQKNALVSQIHAAQQRADMLETQRAHLRDTVAAARGTSLDQQDRGDLAERLRTAQVVAGTSAATGPGIVLTIDNAAHAGAGSSDGDPRTDAGAGPGVVQARDLEIVVNGLWASGAEAIAVNGRRLTSTAAIRFAGAAILVDYRPLARPYVITAVGDPDALDRDFPRSDGGLYVQGLADSVGIRYERTRHDTLTVPAGGSAGVRTARPLGTPTSTPSPTPTETAP